MTLEERDKERKAEGQDRLNLGAAFRGIGGVTARRHQRPRRRA